MLSPPAAWSDVFARGPDLKLHETRREARCAAVRLTGASNGAYSATQTVLYPLSFA